MARPSMNKTALLQLSMDRDTKERLHDYAVERRSSISHLVTEWIWSVKLKADKGWRGGNYGACRRHRPHHG